MKSAIRKIDRAIKELYNLGTSHRAEQFLIQLVEQDNPTDHPCAGRLLIQEVQAEDMNVGIYLNAPVRQSLASYESWGAQSTWSTAQLNAFAVATEEVSHFHYLVHHAQTPRQISQFEMELQGEIDKFLLAYFSKGADGFDSLFARFFEDFKLHADMGPAERDRYTHAIGGARNFLRKHRNLLSDPAAQEKALRLLRRFYRLDQAGKVSLAGA